MKTSFDLSQKLKQFAEEARENQRKLRDGIERNARIACEAMEQAAKDHTPHKDDGKPRGFNTITNALQESWVAKYEPSNNKKDVGTVTLTNDKPYAGYVQNGHRVSKHFVPWLYKDGMGTLSYETDHNQPMFGLVVGAKTPYVKGVDMVGPAEEAFDKVFDKLTKKLLNELK
jgi:hypothetical protein